jgi:transposase
LNYIVDVLQYRTQDLIFIDETGTKKGMFRSHGRAEGGKRCHSSKLTKKGTNVSLVSAISLEGVMGSMTLTGPIDTDAFLVYLHEVLIPNTRIGQVIVMDNLSVHHTRDVVNAILSSGLELVFLPPYTPEFNPIEHCFSKIKAHLRKCAAPTRKLLEAAIKEALNMITADNIKGWFSNCGYVC